jgi:hypothetical protein
MKFCRQCMSRHQDNVSCSSHRLINECPRTQHVTEDPSPQSCLSAQSVSSHLLPTACNLSTIPDLHLLSSSDQDLLSLLIHPHFIHSLIWPHFLTEPAQKLARLLCLIEPDGPLFLWIYNLMAGGGRTKMITHKYILGKLAQVPWRKTAWDCERVSDSVKEGCSGRPLSKDIYVETKN